MTPLLKLLEAYYSIVKQNSTRHEPQGFGGYMYLNAPRHRRTPFANLIAIESKRNLNGFKQI